MKRPFALALLLCAALGAQAQAQLQVSLSGGIKIVDQDGQSAFYQDGAGYDVLTIKAANEKGTYGFSVTDGNILSNSFDIRDWNVWYRILDGKVKVTAGVLRNSDYRITLPNWYTTTYGGTDMVSAQGLLAQVYPVKGLSIGLFLPVSTSDQDFLADTLGCADAGASYSIPNVGTVKALVRMGQSYSLEIDDNTTVSVTDAVMINAGFSYTAIDGLLASILGRIMHSEEADATFFNAAVGADWAMTPKWALRAEVGFSDRPAFMGYTNGTELGIFWDVWARLRYRITDKLYTHVSFRYDQEGDSSVVGALGYTFGDGLGASIHLGWDGELLADLYVYYAVAF
jgi:hypothetical protein